MNFTVTEELNEAISELQIIFPDWRMGQLVATLVMATGGSDAGSIWDIEDEQLLSAAHRLFETNRGRAATNEQQDPGSDGHN